MIIKKLGKKIKSLFRGFWRIYSDFWLNFIAGGCCCPIRLRILIYRLMGNEIGKKCYLSPRCFLGPGNGRIHVGGGTFINYNCWFDLCEDIFIGKNCNIAMNVTFINGTHEIGASDRRAGAGITKPIIVGDGTWIGANSIVLSGVKIGNGCIIGAGSLVLDDCDDNGIYFGHPATLYKKL